MQDLNIRLNMGDPIFTAGVQLHASQQPRHQHEQEPQQQQQQQQLHGRFGVLSDIDEAWEQVCSVCVFPFVDQSTGTTSSGVPPTFDSSFACAVVVLSTTRILCRHISELACRQVPAATVQRLEGEDEFRKACRNNHHGHNLRYRMQTFSCAKGSGRATIAE
jgi:hypothetical protein